MSLTTGDIIEDKYRIVRLIGEGGMGAVYEGENIRIHRRVAIKVLHAGVAENEDAVQRFEREAQAAGRIGSEHICEVLDLGNLPDGDRFMVMEFMEGEDLSSRIRARGKLTPAETNHVAQQLLEGLRAAHAAGIIHRDLKPDNAFLVRSRAGQEDFVKILDFGISKFSALSGESGFSMTRTGAVMGTPYYMSPEQAKGAKGMDARADLYSVGVILYECVTGQVPFNADTFNELLFKIVLETPPPIEQFCPDMDPAFSSIITKAMAREPAHRYQTASEFLDALKAWSQTGAGASIPPEVAHAPGARPQMPSSPNAPVTKASTPGAWANTGSQDAPPPKGKTPVVAAALVGLLVLGGGGAFAAMSLRDSGDAAAAPGADAGSAERERLAAAKAAEEAAAKKKLDDEAAAKSAAAEAAAKKLAEEAAAASSAEAAPAAPAVGAGRTHVAAKGAAPRGAPSPAPAAAPAPAPAPGKGSSQMSGGGRKIRTEL